MNGTCHISATHTRMHTHQGNNLHRPFDEHNTTNAKELAASSCNAADRDTHVISPLHRLKQALMRTFVNTKRAMLCRGVDLGFACWVFAYVSWGMLGLEPPYGGVFGGYNLAWEVIFTTLTCREKQSHLPPESRYNSRWVILILVTATDFLMLAGLYAHEKVEFVMHTLLHTMLWIVSVVFLVVCFPKEKQKVLFLYKYSGYVTFIFQTASCTLAWFEGTQPTFIVLVLVFSMIVAVLRTIQRPSLGSFWRLFGSLCLISHIVIFVTLLIV